MNKKQIKNFITNTLQCLLIEMTIVEPLWNFFLHSQFSNFVQTLKNKILLQQFLTNLLIKLSFVNILILYYTSPQRNLIENLSILQNKLIHVMSCFIIETLIFYPIFNYFFHTNSACHNHSSLNQHTIYAAIFLISTILMVKILQGKSKEIEINSKNITSLIFCSLSCFLFEIFFLEPIHHVLHHSSNIYSLQILPAIINEYSKYSPLFWLCALTSLYAVYTIEQHNTCCSNHKHNNQIELSYIEIAFEKIKTNFIN